MSPLAIIEDIQAASIDDICLVHDPLYVNSLKSLQPEENVMLDMDTPFSKHSFEAAATAVGAVIAAVKFVFERDGNRAFCAVRPPGHHAERSKAMGFCIFNNIAIGAAYAIAAGFARRVVIVDWDLHHGNGTQNAFYNKRDVFYISLHQYPYYPGSGSVSEKGTGDGEGFTLNIPMKLGGGDPDYRRAFDDIIIPAIKTYAPDLIMISAGFDAHIDDPLGGMNLTTDSFGWMTIELCLAANHLCNGRIVSVLEGGYNLKALGDSIRRHLEALANDQS